MSALDRITPAQATTVWGCAAAIAPRVARSCRRREYEVTGPVCTAVAGLLARADDPWAHIGWIVDAVRRELRPAGPMVDPLALPPAANTERITYRSTTPRTRAPCDGTCSQRTARRRAAARRAAIEAGQLSLIGRGFGWPMPPKTQVEIDEARRRRRRNRRRPSKKHRGDK